MERDQLDLFQNRARIRIPIPPPTIPYVRGSDTSAAAAEDIAPHLGRLEAVVLEVIRTEGKHGATDDEIEIAAGLRHQTASARRRGLVIKGMVVDSGERRPTRSGRSAAVWVLA